MRILLIEDDEIISSFIKRALQENGYTVDYAVDGKEGLTLAKVNSESYSVLIVDILLPSLDGISICKNLRATEFTTPILILSAKDQIQTKVEALENGADDYLVKPFNVAELIARVKAMERRSRTIVDEVQKVRHVELSANTNEVKVNSKQIYLTKTEFRLLELLMRSKGKVITRTEMFEKVWHDYGESVTSNSIDVHIKELRKKIKDNPKKPLINTIRGVGYKFSTT